MTESKNICTRMLFTISALPRSYKNLVTSLFCKIRNTLCRLLSRIATPSVILIISAAIFYIIRNDITNIHKRIDVQIQTVQSNHSAELELIAKLANSLVQLKECGKTIKIVQSTGVCIAILFLHCAVALSLCSCSFIVKNCKYDVHPGLIARVKLTLPQ